MPAQELRFRVRSVGALNDFTRARSHLSLALWCDWTREVLEVVGARPQDLGALRALLGERSTRMEEHAIDEGLHVFLVNCTDLPHDLVNKALDESGSVALPPVRFEQGHEEHRVLCFDEARVRGLFRGLEQEGKGVEVLSKRAARPQPLMNTPGAAVNALVESLTDRQLEALVAAQRHGLYASPRRTSPTAVAKSLGIGRTTFEEHLRKAEAKLLANAIPYLELHRKMRALGAAPQSPMPPPVSGRPPPETERPAGRAAG